MSRAATSVAIGLAIHAAIIAGMVYLPLIQARTPHASSVALGFVLWTVAAAEAIASVRCNAGSARPANEGRVLEAVTAGLLLTLTAAALMKNHPTPHGLLFAAIAAILAGTAMRLASIASLGARFLTGPGLAEGHTLHTDGIYAALRHPSETGLLLIAMGCAAISGRAGSWALVPLLAAVTITRIRREDADLRARFGDVFAAYSVHTSALFPGLI